MPPFNIRPVRGRGDLAKFIKLPWEIYADDPAWVPPLLAERRQFLNPKKNPFFKHANVELFLAEKGGKPVGRISAQIDHLHNRTHGEATGFFGLFESVNDPDIASCLLNNAAGWLRARGMRTIRGPFSFSINEEAGLLVEGFEYPPFILTPHNLPYYAGLLENWGLRKCKDLFGWSYNAERPIPEMAKQIADDVAKDPRLIIREVQPKSLDVDVCIGILEPKYALIAEIGGVPTAICLALPNLNEAISDLNGRLFPFGFLKFLYRLKRKKIQSACLILLGIKNEFQRDATRVRLSVLLYTEMLRRSQELGLWRGEISWTLENNKKINHDIELIEGKHYKTYRVYEKPLTPEALIHETCS